MKRNLAIVAALVIASVAGVAMGEVICRSISCRDAIGTLFARGHLLALTNQLRGIYESDLERALDELSYANGDEDVDPDNETTRRAVFSRLIASAAVEDLARGEMISEAEVDRECGLIQSQFHETQIWRARLASNHLSNRSLRSEISAKLRATQWIERQLRDATKVSQAECVEYFNAHHPLFSLPKRYRASHLFLAAPTQTPAPVIDLKSRTIDSLSLRICHGEKFSELVALASEDEFTKKRGGDLGFFSVSRMPPDFFEAIDKMQVGEIGPPIRTALGFHVSQLIDVRPARQLSFEEAAPEIRLELENEKRRAATERVAADLACRAELLTAR